MTISTLFLERPDGRIAYDLRGAGPLVICVAGMADIRATYRFLAPGLADAGFRVATTELRGHGDSDTTFSSYDDAAAASDILALIKELGGPAIVVGHSMGSASGIVAAAQQPALVTGLVLVGPFARDAMLNRAMKALVVALTQPLLVRRFWKSWLPGLYAGRTPADHAAYFDQVMAALALPGHAKAFSRTLRTSHAIAEEHIGSVTAPALVVMGELDKDFPDPAAEAGWIANQLGGEVLMVPEAGHYPHSQRPDIVTPAVVEFVGKVTAGG
jgi:pimeloyl-ACP methyl ester carboxylesterase